MPDGVLALVLAAGITAGAFVPLTRPQGEDRPATFRVAQGGALGAVSLRFGSGQLDVSGHRHLVTPSAR